jgi:tetratricopeptide (TPR) repeat protein
MKLLKIIILFVSIGFSSCESKAQKPDNTEPMYGEIIKSEEYKKLDKEFIEQSIKQFGTIDSAVKFHIDYAWRYFYNNDLETAMKRFNQAWLLDSEYPDSYFGFAALTEMKENKTDANRFYKIGIEKDKGKKRAEICFQRIADCKEQLQDFNGTIEAYNKILELNPTNSFALKKIGYFQMQAGNSENALTAYNKAIELDPADAMTYNNRAYLYQTLKNNKAAISDYTKAIELDPKYISAYVNRGVLSMEEMNYKAAKQDFETSTKLDAKSPELRRFLGLAKLSLKDKLGACEDFKEAKNLGDKQVLDLIEQNCK